MLVLAFETSCDETSAAVVRAGQILSNVVSSQIRLHAEYGGVVPELAAREHLRNLMPVTKSAMREARVTPGDLDAVAATRGPGLHSALMVGLKSAQALAFTLRRPFLGVHHHEAHLYSPWISGDPPRADFDSIQPNVSLIVSGGHTMLVHVKSALKHRVLGSTMDDAAGECFDKTGKLIGLSYPAGPEIDRLAEQGNPAAFNFPRPMLNDTTDDFSFSGLKTSVRYFLRDHPELLADTQPVGNGARTSDPAQKVSLISPPANHGSGQRLRDLCASVQAAIVEVLVGKTIKAARRLGVRCVTASGGVTRNRALRSQFAAACEREGFTLRLAEKTLCTDNAAMIGILAERKLVSEGAATDLDEDIQPGWALA